MSSVNCSFCDKSFANEYILSSHISRYHRENRESDESYTILQPLSKANSDAADIKMDSPDSVYSGIFHKLCLLMPTGRKDFWNKL